MTVFVLVGMFLCCAIAGGGLVWIAMSAKVVGEALDETDGVDLFDRSPLSSKILNGGKGGREVIVSIDTAGAGQDKAAYCIAERLPTGVLSIIECGEMCDKCQQPIRKNGGWLYE